MSRLAGSKNRPKELTIENPDAAAKAKRGRPRKYPLSDVKHPHGIESIKRPKTGGRQKGAHNKGKDPTRCICGRNLLYPRYVTETTIVCRCGRRTQRMGSMLHG